jgi:hypothetical protein
VNHHQIIIPSSSLFLSDLVQWVHNKIDPMSRKEQAMSARILEINFKFSVSPPELVEAFAPLAGEIAKVDGLRWKVWSMDEAGREFAGIYLFDNQASADAYLAGPIVAQLGQHPALSDITAKQFDVLAEPSAVTRGPIG